MRLIFLNRYFWPDVSGSSQMLTDLAVGLAAEAGPWREVVVVTSRLDYDTAVRRFAARERYRDVRVLRVWTSQQGRHGLAGRVVDYLTYTTAAAWRVLRDARAGDVVIIMTDPPLLGLPIAPLARLRGARVVNWLHDIYPEAAQAIGPQSIPHPALHVLAWLRNAELRRADANVVLGSGMARRLRSLVSAGTPIIEIPNWADGDVIRPVAHHENRLRVLWGLEGAFVVAYCGNLGRAHEIATLLDVMLCLAHEPGNGQPIIWLFVGGGVHFKALQTAAAERGLRHARFHPYQPREQLSETLSLADVHLISLEPALEGLVVPSKLYGIMAAGRPAIFIGDPSGEVAHALLEVGCGAAVAVGDAGGLKDRLLAWRDAPALLRSMGLRARAAFEAQHDRNIALRRWRKLLLALAS